MGVLKVCNNWKASEEWPYILEIEKIGEKSLQGQLLLEMTMIFTRRTGAVFPANRENPVGNWV